MMRDVAAQPPTLLISIHDVSPLTLESSRRAVELAMNAGVPMSALTVLVIPWHEGRASLEDFPDCCAWLRSMTDAGACLCMHGYTHRMSGAARWPWQWAWARLFARGQGELFLCETDECERRLEAAQAVFRRAGFEPEGMGFVPPAWLLSTQAQSVVQRAGFAFHERLSGIVYRDGLHARRLIGFGSLDATQARVTACLAHMQARRLPADTRFAIHPADVERASSERAVKSTLARLLEQLRPLNYREFLNHAN
jgi:predicted deacetylase